MAVIQYLEQEARDKLITELTPLVTPGEETPAIFQSLKFYQPGASDQLELISGNVPAMIVSVGNSGMTRESDTGDMYARVFIITIIIEVINQYTDILYFCDQVINAIKGKYYQISWEGGAQLVDPKMNYVYRNLIVTIPGEQAI